MQTAPAAGGTTGSASLFSSESVLSFLPLLALLVLFYFMLIRPQQRRAKQHRELVESIKRGDTVVMSSGIVGKVSRVEDAELQVEIAPNVNVKVVKSMVTEVRNRTTPAPANDAKS